MRVTIVGAGAIGGLLGGHLAQAGHDVLLVDRWAEHVEAINRDGLFVDGIRGEMRLPARAVTPDRLEGPLEAVVVATKSMDTEAAVRQVLPHLGPDGFVLPLVNGLHVPTAEAAMRAAGMDPAGRIMGGIPNYGCGQIGPGHLEFVHEGPIQLGELDGRETPRLRALAGMFTCLTKVEISADITGQNWAKEVYNNQVVCSALANAPLQETLGNPRVARLAGALVREAIAIARANRVEPEAFTFFDPALYDPQTPEETERLVAHIGRAVWLLRKDQAPSGHQFKKRGSGTWWDIKVRGRKSEVRWRNGRLVELGRAAGAPVALTEKLCAMIYEIEDGRREFGFANYDELEAFIQEQGRALP